MIYTGGLNHDYSLTDWIKVIWHGLPVDLSVAAYLTIIPLLLIIFAIWCNRCPVKTIWRVYNGIVALLLALIFVGDSALYPFWGYKLDASIFFYLSSPVEAFASISPWLTVAGFALVIFLAWIIFRFLSGALKPFDEHFAPILMRWPVTLFFLLLIAPLLLAIRGGLRESTMNVGYAYFSQDQYLNHSAVNPAFSLFSSISKSDNFASLYEYFDEDGRSELFEGLFNTGDCGTPKLLKTERPNILILVLEGFGSELIGTLGGQEGVTPCLDSLVTEGIFFSNCYAGSFRTDRGMVCLMNGHPGLPVTSIMKIPAKSSKLPSISGKLVEQSYSASFMYGGDINFTNMKSWLLSHGYSKLTSDIDFSVSERKSNAWGVNDDITFKRLLSELKDNRDSLWHVGMLSLSSHEPFEVPYDKFDDKILNSFAYTDSCMGALVQGLKESNVWDDLLLIMVSDHGFSYSRDGFLHTPRVHHIPLLWLGGAIAEPRTVTELMNQSDIAATLLGQMGIDHSDFLFSRNVLSDCYEYPFAFYTFTNGFCMIDSTGTTIFDDNAGKTIFVEGDGNELRLNRGKAILQTLYDDLDSR